MTAADEIAAAAVDTGLEDDSSPFPKLHAPLNPTKIIYTVIYSYSTKSLSSHMIRAVIHIASGNWKPQQKISL